jgi:hypothetical protein
VAERLEKAGERRVVSLANPKGTNIAYIRPNLKPQRRLEQRKSRRPDEAAS